MDPFTAFVVVTLTLSAAATTQSALESDRAGRERKRASRRQATQIGKAAEEQADAERRRAARFASDQLAKIGASGFTAVGSPLLVVQEALSESFLEQQSILSGGAAQAASVRAAGSAAARAGTGQAIATGLGGAAAIGTTLLTTGIVAPPAPVGIGG